MLQRSREAKIRRNRAQTQILERWYGFLQVLIETCNVLFFGWDYFLPGKCKHMPKLVTQKLCRLQARAVENVGR